MLIGISRLISKQDHQEIESIPLRIWTPDWPIPKRVKLEKYIVNLNTSHQTNVNLNRYALWGEVETITDFKKRVYGNKKPSQWGKGKKSGRRFDYKEYAGKIWIKILSKCPVLNIENRKLSFNGKYLKISLYPTEIGFWYISGEGQVRFIILPKVISLNDKFFELIGILDGEMCKKINTKGGSALKISNTEPIIIKQIIEGFKEFFSIDPIFWAASLTINDKDSNLREQDEKLKKFWSNRLNISLKNFTKTTIQEKYRSKFSEKGIIQIRYSNTLFFIIFLGIMKNIRKIILKNKQYCRAYIRGLVAGEGGIGKRDNKLRIVHIGGMNDQDKIFYSKCLSKLGITSIQKYKLRIEICGLKNFLILEKLDLFRYHPRRKKAFIRALTNLKGATKFTP